MGSYLRGEHSGDDEEQQNYRPEEHDPIPEHTQENNVSPSRSFKVDCQGLSYRLILSHVGHVLPLKANTGLRLAIRYLNTFIPAH
jgi:hypothetical protein